MTTQGQNMAATDAAVSALMNLASEIFTENFIMDMDVRRKVVIMLLETGNFVDYYGDRFDIEEFIGTTSGGVDVFSMSQLNINVGVGLAANEKSSLVLANPDVNIMFHDHSQHSHGKAYAQRVIDTTRLLSRVNHRTGSILDIGGNYASHALADHKFELHSCTKKDSAREWHRQVQRDVRLEYADSVRVFKCEDGVENCDYTAPEGISIHTLPEISPELVVPIFRRHGLVHVEGVHHYDVNIEVNDSGFIPEVDMHWYKKDDYVHFHFEGDSSEGYHHRIDYLLEYATSWTKSADDWPYVVHYTVNSISNGEIYWTMTRLEKSTIGHYVTRPQHRYTPVDDVVELFVPEFDATSGFSVSDPRAYKITSIFVPNDMFNHVYKYGVSNDTERPDLPLTFDQIKDKVQVYNQTRRVNGTAITMQTKMDSVTANRVAQGMYLLVVKRAAASAVVYGEYTNYLKNVQRRWGDESFTRLALKTFSSMAIYPFLMVTSVFSEAVDLVGAHMRSVVREDRVLASAQEIVPYKVLSPVRAVTSIATKVFVPEKIDLLRQVNVDSTRDIRDLYEALGAEMPQELRERVAHILSIDEQSDVTTQRSDVDPDEVRVPRTHTQYPTNGFPDCGPDREEWIAAYDDYQTRIPSTIDHYVDIDSDYIPQVASVDKTCEYMAARIFEYGMYCLDVGLHELSKVKEWAMLTWSGTTPILQEIYGLNSLLSAEVAYYKVDSNGKLLGLPSEFDYLMAYNPVSLSVVQLVNREDGVRVQSSYNYEYVMVCKFFKIFNHFGIARNCISYANELTTITPFSIRMVDGIFGCGKTHEIVTRFTMDDIAVCVVKSSVEDTVREIYKKFNGNVSMKSIEARVRTADSFAMHPEKIPLAGTVFFDEGLLSHSGAVAFVALKSRAKFVDVFGDTRQIKMIERGSKIGLLRFVLFKYVTQYEERNITYRSPADVVALNLRDYPERRRSLIKTCSPIKRSLSYLHVPDPGNALYRVARPFYTYITVLQADKGTICKGRQFINGKLHFAQGLDPLTSELRPVYSVHESQGRTFPKVQVSRLNPQTVGVFDSSAHQLVMTTRATHVFEYVSVAQFKNDTIAQRITEICTLSDQDLEAVMVPTPDWLFAKFESVQSKIGYVD